ncbi:MAG: SDR family oxidoreductase [Bacteroides sp.]|jgi:uncharacterized protein YbjT (DUF2867 family)|nr:SDR family oxidoreductase [Bacteroides sp.]MCI1683440.1 SDR family oxidoreductase [Bacteroides sp.]
MSKQKILVAGATGYLGGYITQELTLSEHFDTKIIVRDRQKVKLNDPNVEIIEAEVTKAETLAHRCDGIDVVISSVGITRQKDGLTYMDVDYQANVNLINEAKASGVKKFIYISVLNGDKMRKLKICEAKEKLVDYLKVSGLEYCIIRPNGFFSDMGDFLKMAQKGTIYLFGDGKLCLNPIHGEDLAKVCIDAISSDQKEINVGGPDLLSQNAIAELAFNAYSKPVKVIHLPDWIRLLTLWLLRIFVNSKTYGPFEFFMTAMAMDMQSPQYGTHKLETFFQEQAKKQG